MKSELEFRTKLAKELNRMSDESGITAICVELVEVAKVLVIKNALVLHTAILTLSLHFDRLYPFLLHKLLMFIHSFLFSTQKCHYISP